MSIAPLHSRPAPLVFVAKEHTKWPHYRPADLKNARLSSRARRERTRRRARMLVAVATGSTAILAAFWLLLSLRG